MSKVMEDTCLPVNEMNSMLLHAVQASVVEE